MQTKHKEPWRRVFEDSACLGLKVCVLEPDGNLLAVAGWAHAGIVDGPDLHGLRWSEFVEPDDVARFLDWLGEWPNSGEAIVTHGLGKHLEEVWHIRIASAKEWVGDAWLVVAEVEPIRPASCAPNLFLL